MDPHHGGAFVFHVLPLFICFNTGQCLLPRICEHRTQPASCTLRCHKAADLLISIRVCAVYIHPSGTMGMDI